MHFMVRFAYTYNFKDERLYAFEGQHPAKLK